MVNLLNINFLILLTILSVSCYSQASNPSTGKYEILALKGSIRFNETNIKKGDTLDFKAPTNKLLYSNSSDWIKISDITTKKIYYLYSHKNKVCNNCLFTRSVYLDFKERIDINDFFNRNSVIFLFEQDTILPLKKKNAILTNQIFFEISINNNKYYRPLGNGDTLIISYDKLFAPFFHNIPWPSFQTDSMRLCYFDKQFKKYILPDVSFFNVYFFEDAVGYFSNMGMTHDEIYSELITYYIDIKTIKEQFNLESIEESEKWLKNKIIQGIYNIRQ